MIHTSLLSKVHCSTMTFTKRDISIPTAGSFIYGDLTSVDDARGLIIFAHGSGSSRFSSRNLFVAQFLQHAQFSTLLFDLLTPEEERIDMYTREFRFNIPLLADRLIVATEWIQKMYMNTHHQNIPIGYFGASTGAAAALIAAAQLPQSIAAVVSRGGRPDLAESFLPKVKAPTLLIVGEYDSEVIALNNHAYNELTCEKNIEIVPGASHLFEETGTLEKAALLAKEWFIKYLAITK